MRLEAYRSLNVPLTFVLQAARDESISECAVRRAIQADVPERRGVCGGSVPTPLAGRLVCPGAGKRGSAQASALLTAALYWITRFAAGSFEIPPKARLRRDSTCCGFGLKAMGR